MVAGQQGNNADWNKHVINKIAEQNVRTAINNRIETFKDKYSTAHFSNLLYFFPWKYHSSNMHHVKPNIIRLFQPFS